MENPTVYFTLELLAFVVASILGVYLCYGTNGLFYVVKLRKYLHEKTVFEIETFA